MEYNELRALNVGIARVSQNQKVVVYDVSKF